MAEKKTTTTVYHPAFPDVSEEVPTGDVDSWTEAGWRKTKLKAAPSE